jgi:CheY-like chemotaxis protein
METHEQPKDLNSSDVDAQTTILLVDDNPVNLQILYETLNGAGYRLLVAKNGDEALSISRQARPQMILLDIQMPDMDGYEVCQRLKSDADMRDTPIIFLSALQGSASKKTDLKLKINTCCTSITAFNSTSARNKA